MFRWFAIFVLTAVTFGFSVGCSQKVTTVQCSEQKCESEPQMVSPGQEVVE